MRSDDKLRGTGVSGAALSGRRKLTRTRRLVVDKVTVSSFCTTCCAVMIYAFSIPMCTCIKSYPPVAVRYMRSTDEEDEEEEEEVSFLLSPLSRDHPQDSFSCERGAAGSGGFAGGCWQRC